MTKSIVLMKQKFREFFIPTVLAAMANQLGTVLDSIVVAALLGTDAMVSVGLCMPYVQAAGAVVVLVAMGSSGMIAVAAGGGRREEADGIFSMVLVLTLGAALTILALSVPYGRELAGLLSGTAELAGPVYEYLSVLVWGLPLMMGMSALGLLLRVEGLARLSSRSVLVSQVVNLGLDAVFMAGFGWGLRGAAYATVIGYGAGLFFLLCSYRKSAERSRRPVNVFIRGLGNFLSRGLQLIHAGAAAALGIGLISLKVWCIYQILGNIGGGDAMKLYAVCMSCLSVVSMVISGCNGAMMPIVGVLYGEGDFRGVRMFLRYVLKFALALTGSFVAVAWLYPQGILALFGIPAELYGEGSMSVRLFSLSLLGTTVTFPAMYYYTTIQRKLAAQLLSVTEGILVVVPGAWLLGEKMGLAGVWLAFILAEAVALGLAYIYARLACSRSGGSLRDVFLIGEGESGVLYDVSLEAKAKNAGQLSSEIAQALKEAGCPEEDAAKVGAALGEMVLNIGKMAEAGGKPSYVDVCLKQTEDGFILRLRDGLGPFNQLEIGDRELQTENIKALKVLSRKAEYNRVLALNQTQIAL